MHSRGDATAATSVLNRVIAEPLQGGGMAEAQRLVRARNVLVQEAIGAKALMPGSAWTVGAHSAAVVGAEPFSGGQSGQSQALWKGG